MIKDYKVAKHKLEQKQNNERELFERNYIHNLECLHAQQKIDLDHLDNRMNVVNIRQEEAAKESPKVILQHHISMASSEGPQREKFLPPLIAPNDEEKIAESNKREAEKRKRARTATVNRQTRTENSFAKPIDAEDDPSVFVTKSRAEPPNNENDDGNSGIMKDLIVDTINEANK